LGQELVEKTSEHFNAKDSQKIQKPLLNSYSRENCHYFKSLEATLKEVDDDLIYNFDETGFSIGGTSNVRGTRDRGYIA
jgi:hypothetical protein